ncbi:dual specificity tyrosine-phosphorylation-regulated kinase 2-like [Petromyzon marinus]|uniref:dual specificity tyrosine-phosphorylation-regulated kinase 2-like n=1 Tax=Petromyzon marinus TaxID=7757 RepID=UPI003F6F9005
MNRKRKYTEPPGTNGIIFSVAGRSCTPQDTLERFKKRMTIHEQNEILEYNEIFYFKVRDTRNGINNYGYDDLNHHYIPVVNGHLAYRYQVLSVLGKGKFGQVLLCLDHKFKSKVAVKMLRHSRTNNPNENIEVDIMNALQSTDEENNHIIRLLDKFTFRGHFTMVLELLAGDLRKQLMLKYVDDFPLSRVRLYCQSILKALVKLRKEAIIHGDLKPANILIKNHKTGNVRITDFGVSVKLVPPIFKRLGTWPYMAPEMFLMLQIGCSVDMWSLGCVIAELASGSQIFFGNRDHIGRVIKVLGVPPLWMINSSGNQLITIDNQDRPIFNGRAIVPHSISLQTLLKTKDKAFLDFIKGCLEWDPACRLTPEEALEHDWVQGRKMAKKNSAVPSINVRLRHIAAPREQSFGSNETQESYDTPGGCGTLSATKCMSQERDGDDDAGSSLEEFVTARSEQLDSTLCPGKEDQENAENEEKEKEAIVISRMKPGKGHTRGFEPVRQRFRAFLRFIRKHCCCGCDVAE